MNAGPKLCSYSLSVLAKFEIREHWKSLSTNDWLEYQTNISTCFVVENDS